MDPHRRSVDYFQIQICLLRSPSFLSPVEYVFSGVLNGGLNDLFLNEHICFMTISQNVHKRLSNKEGSDETPAFVPRARCQSLRGAGPRVCSSHRIPEGQEETGWSRYFQVHTLHIYALLKLNLAALAERPWHLVSLGGSCGLWDGPVLKCAFWAVLWWAQLHRRLWPPPVPPWLLREAFRAPRCSLHVAGSCRQVLSSPRLFHSPPIAFFLCFEWC